MAVAQSALKFYFPITSVGYLSLNSAKCGIQHINKKTFKERKEKKCFESDSPRAYY